MKLINVMLVDDHTLIRHGLRMIIESEKDIKIIAEAKDGDEAIKKALSAKPDVIIMDINMPVLNGLESLKQIKELGLQCKVIMLTGYQMKQSIIAANKIGAKGYLFKDSEPNSLIKAIREVYSGRTYIDLAVANVLTHGNAMPEITVDNEPDKISLLSKREYEVLILISEGHNNKRIGKELFISEKTVKNHITQIFKKLEIDDRVQAVIFAYKNSIK